MGAKVVFDKESVTVESASLKGLTIDVNACIDAIPIFAVLGCYAKGVTELKNGAIARTKESNRLAVMTRELKKMGASIEETEDGLRIYESQLIGTSLDAHGDHRVAMALAVAAQGAKGESVIHGVECVAKTYASFLIDMQSLGLSIKEGL